MSETRSQKRRRQTQLERAVADVITKYIDRNKAEIRDFGGVMKNVGRCAAEGNALDEAIEDLILAVYGRRAPAGSATTDIRPVDAATTSRQRPN